MKEHLVDFLPQLGLLGMLAIVFMQSSLDKIFDWKGNLEFMNSHFKTSLLKHTVKVNMLIITILELFVGVFSIVGIFDIVWNGKTFWALIACVLAVVTFLSLLLGQRLAKDYAGAQTIVIYLMPTIFLLFLLTF
jgi:hypothetical protein